MDLSDQDVQWEAGVVWDSGIIWYAGGGGKTITNGLKVRDIFPSTDGDINDDCCVPMPFGTCYIPIRSAYITDDRYYVLGQTVSRDAYITYTISNVRTPRDYSTKTEWPEESPSIFPQYTKTSDDGHRFRVFQALIAEGDVNGVFPNGDHFYDMPTNFSRSDTVSITNPSDVIKWVLIDIGLDESIIDTTTFTSAGSTFTSWGLEFNGAVWEVITREKILTHLLSMCNSTIIPTEKVELHVLSSTSQKTITSADITKDSEVGIGSFRHSKLDRTLNDCGNVSYSPASDSQDIGVNALVQAKDSQKNIDPEIIEMPFISDATIAKKLAKLYYQRKLLKKAEESMTVKSPFLILQPSDFVTIQGTNYGGEHDAMIDSITIRKDLSVDLKCITFKDTIENY
jgi:hypothetical protein